MTLKVSAIKALNDNYIWCIEKHDLCLVVDPGDATPVLEYCRQQHLTLAGILITHHHWDHTDGLPALLEAFAGIPVWGPENPAITPVTHRLHHQQQLHIPEFSLTFTVLAVPGHTLDHIAYYGHNMVFCGDTLFSAGCGRLFEGTASQMHQSLAQLAALPAETRVYCTHEYTLANIKFALAVEPTNLALIEYQVWATGQRQNGQCTLPSTIATERAVNPFLRCSQPEVLDSLETHTKTRFSDEDQAFAALRRWKDQF